MSLNLEEWLQEIDEDLWNNLQKIKERSKEVWKTSDHGNYTDHGIKHSEAIIRELGDLIPDELLGSSSDSILNPYSIFILLASAYLHDIGMQAQKFSGKYKSKKWDLGSIRKIHHEISEEWITEDWKSLGIRKEVDANWIGRISKGHSKKVDSKEICLPISEYPGTQRIAKRGTIHPRFLAALLRLADALHIASDRINVDELRKKELPLDSKVEWWLHYYVSGIDCNIAKNKCIKIDFQVPLSFNGFWQRFIPKLILKRIQEDYDSVKRILAHDPYGIPIVDVVEGSKPSFKGKDMPPEVFEYMLFYALCQFDLDGYPQLHLDLIEKANEKGKTLENFPEAFKPLVIIPGDVREEPPQCAQDLLADSASTADLSWIFKTTWPEDTILLTDKFAAHPALRDFLKDRNLLVIGSPGTGWLSRYIWRKGPFYFEINKKDIAGANERESNIKKMTGANGLRQLEKYERDNSRKLKDLENRIKGQLYDSLEGKEYPAELARGKKLGVISLCKHPFSEDHYAILVGGPHLLGTMAAEKMLLDRTANKDREELKKRPFGGIVQATSTDEIGLGYIYATIEWITEEYSSEDLKKALRNRLQDKGLL